MKILAFGYHDREAPRHHNLCKMLQEGGYVIQECHTVRRGLLAKYADLFGQWRTLRHGSCALLVTFPGHYLVPLAWLLTRFPRRRLIFDAFLSLHDSIIHDRKLYPRWHPYALWFFALDYLSCHLADEVLLDTEAHRQFFLSFFHLSPACVRAVPLGSREDLFRPCKERVRKPDGSFEVFFYGSYIPLQGVEYILEAAAIVQRKNARVHFTLLGAGQTYAMARNEAVKRALRNVTFHEPVPLHLLPGFLCNADLSLGIFGTTDKARRVVPHKVYDAVSCGVPVLTQDSPAMREQFGHHPLVILCPGGSGQEIARHILQRARQRG